MEGSRDTASDDAPAHDSEAPWREAEWRVQELIRLHDELDADPELRDRSIRYLVRQGFGLVVAAYLSATLIWVARDTGVQGILVAVLAVGWLVVGGIQWAKHRRMVEVKRRIAELENGETDDV